MQYLREQRETLNRYVTRWHILTGVFAKELAACNDFSSKLLLDTYIDAMSFKFNPPLIGFRLAALTRSRTQLIRSNLRRYQQSSIAERQTASILLHQYVREYASQCNFPTANLREAAVLLAEMYIQCYSHRSWFVIETSQRQYTGEGLYRSLSVRATTDIPRDRLCKDLLMFCARMQNAEPMPHGWDNYVIHRDFIGKIL